MRILSDKIDIPQKYIFGVPLVYTPDCVLLLSPQFRVDVFYFFLSFFVSLFVLLSFSPCCRDVLSVVREEIVISEICIYLI